MLVTKQPLAVLRPVATDDTSLVRELSALRTTLAASPKSASFSAKDRRNAENTQPPQRSLTTLTAGPSSLSPTSKPKPVPVTSPTPPASFTAATPKKPKSLTPTPSSAGQLTVTPRKGLTLSTSHTSSIPADASTFVPSSPIASASPTARRVRVAMHPPPAAASPPVQPPPTPKKNLFSPQYNRAEEERQRKARLVKRGQRTPKARTQTVSASSTITTVAASHAATSPQPAAVAEEDAFDPFSFIRNLPPLSSLPPHRIRPLPAKRSPHPLTLALDLDETLVHCSVQPIPNPELTFTVQFNGADYTVYVRTRPYMADFLRTVSQWYEVVIFTASQQVYADRLLDILDVGGWVEHRVFRDSCVCYEGNFLKDLTVLGRDMRRVAIVDNSIQAFGFQVENGIPIESWFDDEADCELKKLLPFLERMKDAQDVRPLITETFRLQEMIDRVQ